MFTKEQIIAVLRGHEAGAKAADLARKYRISELFSIRSDALNYFLLIRSAARDNYAK